MPAFRDTESHVHIILDSVCTIDSSNPLRAGFKKLEMIKLLKGVFVSVTSFDVLHKGRDIDRRLIRLS
jgi:hypothetical protein